MVAGGESLEVAENHRTHQGPPRISYRAPAEREKRDSAALCGVADFSRPCRGARGSGGGMTFHPGVLARPSLHPYFLSSLRLVHGHQSPALLFLHGLRIKRITQGITEQVEG